MTLTLAYSNHPWTLADDLEKLCEDFPAYDRGLIEVMLADQGGDVPEVHACLRVMLICLDLHLLYHWLYFALCCDPKLVQAS